jgi:hypothetical protein
MLRVLAACGAALLAATAARAAPPNVEPIRLTLRPAAAPEPALRYRLLPELRDQKPGNAAELYGKAVGLLESMPADPAGKRQRDEQMDQWQRMPLGDLPRADVRRSLEPYKEMFRLVEQAARCEHCDWGLAQRIREKGIGVPLPEFQGARQIASFLAVRARLEMAEGRLDDALSTLRTGFALARHVGDAPTLITGLIGIAIGSTMAGQLDVLIQQPGAPNLSWPLTDLPRPFIDLRRPLQGERISAYAAFPGCYEMVADPHARPLAPEQARKLLAVLNANPLRINHFPESVQMIHKIMRKHEQAKRVLITQGRPRELVEAMPHVQVALLHSFAQYDRFLDEVVKWQTYPCWEARPHLADAVKRLEAQAKSTASEPAFPFAAQLLPAIDKVLAARTRLDRKLAALRCLEALRLYAARTGRLPATLGDVKDVPVPIDPFTGEKFAYEAHGERATLSSPPAPGVHGGYEVSYEVTLQR